MAVERFSVTSNSDGSTVVVTVTGEVDLAAAEGLQTELDRWQTTGRDVLLDCSQITFIDSMGLRALMQARLTAETSGTTFQLSDVPADVLRVFELAGVATLLDITVAPALADGE